MMKPLDLRNPLKGENIASKMALVYDRWKGSTSNLSSHRLIEEKKGKAVG